MEYSFHIYNKLATDGVAMSTDKLLRFDKKNKTRGAGMRSTMKNSLTNTEKPPVIVCIGSDLAIGDSLGPITGSMLKFKTQGLNIFLYGTLSARDGKGNTLYAHFFKGNARGKPSYRRGCCCGERGGYRAYQNQRFTHDARCRRKQTLGLDRGYFRYGRRSRKICGELRALEHDPFKPCLFDGGNYFRRVGGTALGTLFHTKKM